MPVLSKDLGKDLKALIFDLDESGCKQALFGMVDILTEHPSVLMDVFREFIFDARSYAKARRDVAVKRNGVSA